ncbi:peptidylprolyl isomerase [Alcaligenes sp. SDU_A2]|uniref:peptidylprolyl isomerase n=1 Tax=Alcaligenes sp. SDU_A2 TaxID=3136634 RepID=UPI0031202B05
MNNMRFSLNNRTLALALAAALGLGAAQPVWAQAKQAKAAQSTAPQFVDGIAAVVNDEVITLRQVELEAAQVRAQLQHQKIPAPDQDVLRKQVLQRLINERLEQQEARVLGIRVAPEQVTEGVRLIASRNKMTEAQLRAEVEKNGISWDQYLVNLRQEILLDQLRMRAVDSSINITDADIDTYLRAQGGGAGLASLGQPAAQQQDGPVTLAQILVRVPENADASEQDRLRRKAEGLLAQARSGADFAGLAASSSDGQEALSGGVLGTRSQSDWPDLFVQAIHTLEPGQVSGLVRSGQGFHILKLLERGSTGAPVTTTQAPGAGAVQSGPMMVTQTHARHILVKLSKVRTSEQARQRVEQLHQRLNNGESFEALAKSYSEDSSAPQGGDLGWLSPGETVPPFEQAMDKLEPGKISGPVQSQFGWHLIQVVERRTRNMENEYKRMQARQILFQQRAEPAFEDWLNGLRGRAYIDNRLDPESSTRKR